MKNHSKTVILAIETSCDETSAAVISDTEILSNVVYSQLELHAEFGGVVPSIARTEHEKKIPEIVEQAVTQADINMEDLTHIAVTQGPGLSIALEVGILKAKELAKKYSLPLIGINHMEGHLVSSLVGVEQSTLKFPVIGVLVSGGHTELVLVSDFGEYKKVGVTLDDACGEAFDKAAVMLGLGYPGGPAISKSAEIARGRLRVKVERHQQSTLVRAYGKNSDTPKYELPIPMLNSGDLNLSYSGLKTAVKQVVNNLSGNSDFKNIRETAEGVKLTEDQVEDLALVFEEAATEQIVRKLKSALKRHPEIREVWMGGGVIANNVLKEKVSSLLESQNVTLRVPSSHLLTADNAGMIGLAAAIRIKNGDYRSDLEMDRSPGLSL